MNRGILLTYALAAACVAPAGCGSNAKFMTEARKDRGLVVILPGIEGESDFNRHIREGLDDAGVRCAMPIKTWGYQIPILGLAINQVDVIGHLLSGKIIAKEIVKYQKDFPDRPVFIIGHSGGGGVAVFALEYLAEMPDAKPIDGAILLSPSVSASHDLTKAMKSCRRGIVNFYNEKDLLLLGLGTTLLGNMDGGHGAPAGRSGFDMPEVDDSFAKQRAYRQLYQVEITPEMTRGVSGTSHSVDTNVNFVLSHVAQWVQSPTWPADEDEE